MQPLSLKIVLDKHNVFFFSPMEMFLFTPITFIPEKQPNKVYFASFKFDRTTNTGGSKDHSMPPATQSDS